MKLGGLMQQIQLGRLQGADATIWLTPAGYQGFPASSALGLALTTVGIAAYTRRKTTTGRLLGGLH
jgi:hypothetical protein